MLEFALVLPVLISFLAAIVTGGVAIGQSVSLNNASREAARYGAVLPVDGDLNTWLGSVADVAISAAAGDLSPSAAGQVICVAYVHPDGVEPDDRTVRIVETNGVRTVTTGATCRSDGRPSSERRVQVTVARSGYFDAFVFTTDLTLDGHAVARFERFDR